MITLGNNLYHPWELYAGNGGCRPLQNHAKKAGGGSQKRNAHLTEFHFYFIKLSNIP